jgi:hypothetical protein
VSLGYQCDRCKAFGHAEYGEQREPGPFPPENWRQFSGPVRGSQGARSSQTYTLCDSCDDDLYRFLTEAPR